MRYYTSKVSFAANTFDVYGNVFVVVLFNTRIKFTGLMV